MFYFIEEEPLFTGEYLIYERGPCKSCYFIKYCESNKYPELPCYAACHYKLINK